MLIQILELCFLPVFCQNNGIATVFSPKPKPGECRNWSRIGRKTFCFPRQVLQNMPGHVTTCDMNETNLIELKPQLLGLDFNRNALFEMCFIAKLTARFANLLWRFKTVRNPMVFVVCLHHQFLNKKSKKCEKSPAFYQVSPATSDADTAPCIHVVLWS